MAKKNGAANNDAKIEQLSQFTTNGTDQPLTTNQGLKINDNQNSLKAGERGPTLLEDFIMREKITHFDHERIPERIVHESQIFNRNRQKNAWLRAFFNRRRFARLDRYGA